MKRSAEWAEGNHPKILAVDPDAEAADDPCPLLTSDVMTTDGVCRRSADGGLSLSIGAAATTIGALLLLQPTAVVILAAAHRSPDFNRAYRGVPTSRIVAPHPLRIHAELFRRGPATAPAEVPIRFAGEVSRHPSPGRRRIHRWTGFANPLQALAWWVLSALPVGCFILRKASGPSPVRIVSAASVGASGRRPLSPGDKVRSYKIVGPIGNTGFLFEARDAAQRKRVIRVTPLEPMEDWTRLQRFEQQATILLKLDHSVIPRYSDAFTIEDGRESSVYLVQKYAGGRSLSALKGSGWRPTELQVCAIALQILDALAYCSQFRPPVAHGNIDSNNILLQGIRANALRVSLVNFVAPPGAGVGSGSYGYLAPEQYAGSLTPQSDLYALGALLAALLTGSDPADLPDGRIPEDRLKSATTSPALGVFIRTLLQPNPTARYRCATAAAAALAVAEREVRAAERQRATVFGAAPPPPRPSLLSRIPFKYLGFAWPPLPERPDASTPSAEVLRPVALIAGAFATPIKIALAAALLAGPAVFALVLSINLALGALLVPLLFFAIPPSAVLTGTVRVIH